jgi:RimJ/RimL family protein N-acetyltransferase
MDPLPVRLRPFTESDLVLFDQYANDRELSEPFEWLGFTSSKPFRRRWQEDRLLGSSPYCLAVAAMDGDASVGWVDWRQNDRPGPGVWEVGVLIVPEMRGRGAGTAAQDILVKYLFSTTTAHRIWAGTEVDNVAEQRALERCGFRQEGRLRGAHFRDGQWRDSLIYGITRDDMRGASAPGND